MRRNWWCGRGKWCILGMACFIIVIYQLFLTIFIVTRFNVILLFIFLIFLFITLFRLFFW